MGLGTGGRPRERKHPLATNIPNLRGRKVAANCEGHFKNKKRVHDHAHFALNRTDDRGVQSRRRHQTDTDETRISTVVAGLDVDPVNQPFEGEVIVLALPQTGIERFGIKTTPGSKWAK